MKFHGPIVITSCTNRKRNFARKPLHVRKLKLGPFDKVAAQWLDWIQSATETVLASELYLGRSIRDAKASKEALDGHLFIVSAGLGLVSENKQIPEYSLTVSRASSENIQKRIKGDGFTHEAWWKTVNSGRKPYASLHQLIKFSRPHGVAIAMPTEYWQLVRADLQQVPEFEAQRLRLFGPKNTDVIPDHLVRCIMPYDDRLDGPDSPISGTKTDFPQRAMRHFVQYIAQNWEDVAPEVHAKSVQKKMAKFRAPTKFNRAPKTDDQLVELIQLHWDKVEGYSTRMLRYFRDDLKIACEQKRFQGLFQVAKQQRLEER